MRDQVSWHGATTEARFPSALHARGAMSDAKSASRSIPSSSSAKSGTEPVGAATRREMFSGAYQRERVQCEVEVGAATSLRAAYAMSGTDFVLTWTTLRPMQSLVLTYAGSRRQQEKK
eukprot:3865614-Rhodomonas_salina.4